MLRWLPLALIAFAAFWVRTRELDRRPMHADEANQAVKLGELLERGRYAFDPRDHHGPTLYYAAVPIAVLRGERSLAALTEPTLRLVPALFGTASVVLLALIALPLVGRGPALLAATFLALSPPSVYYSRYFIQETLLVTFTLATIGAAQVWWRRGLTRWAVLAGVCAGLAQATKASAPLFLAAAAIACLVARTSAPATKRPRRDFAFALIAALVTAALLYSSLGLHPRGLVDAFASYTYGWTRATGEASGHEKAWTYYLALFGWQRRAGFVWEQIGFSLLALGGLAIAFARAGRPFRAAAIYTLIVAGVLSAIPYKTPWHAVHFVPGMAVLGAGALATLTRLRTGKFVAAAIAIVVAGMLAQQTRLVAFQRPADQRNPYAYVHSSPDVLKVRALAEAALAAAPSQPVRVIAEEYWPLPWYLRGLPRVGFWSTPPDDCDGALVITSMTQADAVRAKLRGHYRESFLGLRPGVLCVIFTPDEATERPRE